MADDVVIRAATHDDIGGIVEMAQKFYATTDYSSLCQMDDAQAAGLAILLIDTGIMLVAADYEGDLVGMIGLHVEPFTFNPSVLMATEIVFWINETDRGNGLAGHMLEAAGEAAQALGCSVIRMQALRTSDKRIANLYAAHEYVMSETIYTRRLN